ncbi:MAG: hypothetical protein R3343_12130 [Nitriliruptorales bacterium]|nr:hypothetical protein [Nitriliruptorales bacterium]
MVNLWRFAAAYLDQTGLYKMGQRYYEHDIACEKFLPTVPVPPSSRLEV